MRSLLCALLVALITIVVGCETPTGRALAPRSQTFAELRVVRRGVTVVPPDEAERPPVTRERLVDGEVVKLAAGGLAWLRRDGGATLLVAGPGSVRVLRDAVEVESGKVFIDAPSAEPTRIVTKSSPLLLAKVRASLEVGPDGAASAYVLAGEVRAEPAEGSKDAKTQLLVAKAGEELRLAKGGAGEVRRVVAWEDWTGGLATTDRSAAPPPFGVGTVGARPAGDLGASRTPLVIQSLDVRVTIAGDFATTEVDEEFFNPQSQTVEGIYRMRVPRGASLERFGVDRMGAIAWGYVKEKGQAAAQYQSHVYQGSTEDPALLQWVEPGVFEAKLYPLGPGATRRVVTRWTEWLPRGGKKGERRLYVYPMAAEGAEGSLPVIEELTASVDLLRSGATEVRSGLGGVSAGDPRDPKPTLVIIRKQDFVPRADLAIELFDAGVDKVQAVRAPHRLDPAVLAPNDRARAEQLRTGEADYVLVPIRPDAVKEPDGGLDVAIVVDTSAATDDIELALARSAAASLLAHLGSDDRVAVFAADDRLRPAAHGSDAFAPVDAAKRRELGKSLAELQQGGATDLGAVMAEASAKLDPARRGAVVYIGDGAATVGERSLGDLRARLAKLPRPARTFALATGDGADLALLDGISQGGFAARVTDGASAARAALAILETAERPALLRTKVDLGPGVERVYPRELGALVADESILLVGRLTGEVPKSASIESPAGTSTIPLEVVVFDDRGDLRRRWAESRLGEMLEKGDGRAALVDLGVRHGIITPVTSFYVPTAAEMTPQEVAELRQRAQSGEINARNEKRREAQRTTASVDGDEEGERDGKKGGKNAETGKDVEEEKEPEKPGFFDRLTRGASKDEAAKADAAPAARAQATATPEEPSAPAAELLPESADMPASPKPVMKAPAKEEPAAAVAAAPAASAAPSEPMERALKQENGQMGLLDKSVAEQGYGSGAGRLGGAHKSGREDDQGPREKQIMNPNAAPPPAPAGDPLAGDDGRFAAGRPMDLVPSNGPMQPGGGLGLSGIGEGGGGRGEGIGLASIGTLGSGGKVRSAGGETLSDSEASRVANELDLRSDDAKAKAQTATTETYGDTGGYRVQVGVTVAIGDRLGRRRLGCGAAADAPLSERMGLWRERLAKTGGNPGAVASVYRLALMRCEAPGPRERTLLLGFLLDALPTPSQRVQLWRQMQGDLGAADVLYRGLLARVRTADEARELSAALGLRTAPPDAIDKILKEAKTDADRAAKLRALSAMWPDDHELSLRLLDALEDAKDDGAARELGHRLRRRADVDARVRTAVGELHLRLAAASSDPATKAADEQEARRAFGEIVEFSPDDPAARRRLGDLLRSHGWFEEAARQYETLEALLPNDPGVALLRGTAAEGLGKLEDAVKLAEKGIASGPPDARSGPAATARALAATFLAWGQLAAKDRNDAAEGDRLAARKARMLPTGPDASTPGSGGAPRTRVAAVWSHPDLHPTLWSNVLGTPLPTTEGDPTLGVAQVDAASRPGSWIELRVDPLELARVARLGAEIDVLFAIAEGTKEERLIRKKVRFARGGPAELRFSMETGEPLEIPRGENEVKP